MMKQRRSVKHTASFEARLVREALQFKEAAAGPQHRTKLHSANPIERLNGEIKRLRDPTRAGRGTAPNGPLHDQNPVVER